MTVLLVDDEATMRKMIRLMLQKRGHQVWEAAGAAEAMTLSQAHSIDVLVTDVVLAESNGTDLARAIAERSPGLPVLFISGQPMDFEAERHRHARCAFLPKPFQFQELVRALGELTGAAA